MKQPVFSADDATSESARQLRALRSESLLSSHRAHAILQPTMAASLIIGGSQASQYQVCSLSSLFATASILPDSSFGLCGIFLCLLLGFPFLVSLSLLLLSHSFVVGSLLFCPSWYLDAQSTSDQSMRYGICLFRTSLGRSARRGSRAARRRSKTTAGWRGGGRAVFEVWREVG